MKLKQVLKKSNVVATVISLVERAETRQETVQSLIDFGLDVKVIESDPRDDAQNYGNKKSNALASVKAIQFALENKKNLLFVEDDVYFSKHFGVFVNWAAESDKVTYFYAHDETKQIPVIYPLELITQIKAREKQEPRFIPFNSTSWLPFTQCVYIPLDVLQTFNLEDLAKGGVSFDIWLMNHINKNKLAPQLALPHQVQHKGVRLGREKQDPQPYKRSLSFVEDDRYVPEIQHDSNEVAIRES